MKILRQTLRLIIFSLGPLLTSLAIAAAAATSGQSFEVGAARSSEYELLLKNKRIGLVVNQASLVSGVHTIDLLLKRNLKIIKLFGLEHGVRGTGGSGESIPDSIDPETGLPIVSLHGKIKKPTPESLRDLDVVVFDIQDVGARFYTFISSLGFIMEAAAENGVPVIVFDRPNPNADYVEGPVLKKEHKSFVGKYPIPVVYGLTIGELARMIHGEKWMHTDNLDLTVIKMTGFDRKNPPMPEGRPSSGLREPNALRAYPWLCLFEPTIISVGKGTDHPYVQYGIPGEPLGSHQFTPAVSDKHPMYEGQTCNGEEFYSRPYSEVPRFTTDIFVKALKAVKRRPFVTDRPFLDLLVGDAVVVDMMLAGKSYAQIKPTFANALADYRRKRAKYLLY